MIDTTEAKLSEQITDAHLAGIYAVVLLGEWFERERWQPWNNVGFVAAELPPAAYLREQGGRIAIVDCHS